MKTFLSSQDGDRGYLEGLASRYADLFSTHYGDVLDHLEELRRREWDEMSPRIRVLGTSTPGTPGTPGTPPGTQGPSGSSIGSAGERGPMSGHCGQMGGLTTSLSQPIYVPGKYSVSIEYFTLRVMYVLFIPDVLEVYIRGND